MRIHPFLRGAAAAPRVVVVVVDEDEAVAGGKGVYIVEGFRHFTWG